MRPMLYVVAVFCLACSSCTGMEAATPTTGHLIAESQTFAQPPFKVLYRFRGHLDGGEPKAELTEVSGLLYGTTSYGGSDRRRCFCGTVFSLDASGHETVLHRFQGRSDGASPDGSLTYLNGSLYGTTTAGGSDGSSKCSGCGTLFAIDPSGAERVVHTFGGFFASVPDGDRPSGKLVALKGKLFGTTQGGGSVSCDCGTVFVYDPSTGQEKLIYSFTGAADSGYPVAGLSLIGSELYGTASGGNGCGPSRCGSVFRIDSSGAFHLVHSFSGNDGGYPSSNVVRIGTTLYGTTYNGGNGCFVTGCGTIYAIDKNGKERVVWLFGVDKDGSKPMGHVAVLRGQIYGTTEEGGNTQCVHQSGCGTIFRFDPSNVRETKLHTFTAAEGDAPLSGVVQRGDVLYGTTYLGAMDAWGSVFSLTP